MVAAAVLIGAINPQQMKQNVLAWAHKYTQQTWKTYTKATKHCTYQSPKILISVNIGITNLVLLPHGTQMDYRDAALKVVHKVLKNGANFKKFTITDITLESHNYIYNKKKTTDNYLTVGAPFLPVIRKHLSQQNIAHDNKGYIMQPLQYLRMRNLFLNPMPFSPLQKPFL